MGFLVNLLLKKDRYLFFTRKESGSGNRELGCRMGGVTPTVLHGDVDRDTGERSREGF